MLDIQLKWFLVQMATFLFLLVFLNKVLFKPLLSIFKEREDNTTGSLEKAKAMDKEKDDVLARIDEKLVEGRGKAKKAFEEQTKEGTDIQRGFLESAKKEAVEINIKAKEELEAATGKAREELKSKIEIFSRQIVEKLAQV